MVIGGAPLPGCGAAIGEGMAVDGWSWLTRTSPCGLVVSILGKRGLPLAIGVPGSKPPHLMSPESNGFEKFNMSPSCRFHFLGCLRHERIKHEGNKTRDS